MRSTRPMPGNPWPHDMVLSIETDPHALVDLLWVRAAWALDPPGDAPPAPEIPAEPALTAEALRRDKGDWNRTWAAIWSEALRSLGRPREPSRFEAVRAAPPGSEERARLLADLIGPTWRDRVGPEAFEDPRYDRWTAALAARSQEELRLPLDEHPERRDLDWTIGAWRRGLETIVVLPCAGDHTRTISPTALCTTRETRADPRRFRAALAAFPSF